MTTHRTAPFQCPTCKRALDAHTAFGVGVKPPEDGDFSVCAYCVTMLRYARGADGSMTIVRLSATEFSKLPAETREGLDAASLVACRLSKVRSQAIYVKQPRGKA